MAPNRDGQDSSGPENTLPLPPGWGRDALSDFIETARHNTIATFANLRPQYDALMQIDTIYREMIADLSQNPELVSGLLLFRSHSSFLGAVRLSLSGQVGEAYMVLRGCLESALYGFYVAGDTRRQNVWLNRHVDDASRRLVKSQFTICRMMDQLRLTDPKTCEVAQALYERTIDYGAHPNERAVTAQVKVETQGLGAKFTARYFVCNEPLHLACLRSTTQVGICCLDIFRIVFGDRYRVLGIDQRLDRLRKGF